MLRGALPIAIGGLALVACAEPPRVPRARAAVTAVELAAFEIRADQIDRFEHCPPAGEIGQDWVPPIPEWHPPAASASAAVPESAVDGTPTDTGSPATSDSADSNVPASAAELTDEAANQTRQRFRSCYHHGLLFDPTQDGHVAVVMRVDRTGKVASVETWGACDLATEAIVCIRDEAKHVKLRPPIGGSATLTVPAVFTNDAQKRTSPNDGYAAAAYVAIETMRPRLHRCEEAARFAHEGIFATAVLSIDIDAKGHGYHVGVDQWKGGHEVLGCAAEVLRDAPFPPPPAGQGKVVVPLVFNPRPGTR
jgi:hypothetical protein